MPRKNQDNHSKPSFRAISLQAFGLLLVSAASLSFEINLIRLFSVAQFYHFAFMVVSLALLGFGASGTFLALRKEQPIKDQGIRLGWLSGASGLSMLGAYLLINFLPFDSYSMMIAPEQIGIFFLHYAALASPFFFTGMIISLMLRQERASTGSVYAVNMIGSAIGCLAAVFVPIFVDGEGVVAFSAGLAAISSFFFLWDTRKDSWITRGVKLGPSILSIMVVLSTLLVLGLRIQSGEMPEFFALRLSPYKSLSYALQPPQARLVSSDWNSFSKVDVVQSPSLHSVPGLSYRYSEPLPSIQGVFVDGDNLNAILPASADLKFADHLPGAVAFELRPNADLLILEPKGGLDVLAALELGAKEITAVENNPLIVAASRHVYANPGVYLVNASGRSFLARRYENYDLIQLPLTDSYHPVGSGAYALGEDYRYSVEAFSDMINSLKPGGLLVITRWLQEEPSEWLRTFTLAVTALEGEGLDPFSQIIALRGYNTGTLLINKTPFNDTDLEFIRRFSEEKAFDLVFGPGVAIEDVNRFNILPEPVFHQTFAAFVSADSREDFYRAYPFDVRPPTDDQPFFGHYFKWSQVDEILSILGVTWQPFGGAGYLVVIIILIFALVASSVLILLPAIALKKTKTRLNHPGAVLYFGAIGLAFMLVEMPLIQRFILYLDQPAYAFSTVLFCILLFSGLGSRYGRRLFSTSTALIALIGLLVLYMLVMPPLIQETLGLPLVIRLAISITLLFPLGFLMGIPFPSGLMRVQAVNVDQAGADQRILAWMWAVNGACSVLASILASLFALSFGFGVTLLIGTGFYLLAWIESRKLDPRNLVQD